MTLELEAYEPLAGTLRSPTITRALSPSVEIEKINVGILALDIGTKMGWAVRGRDGRLEHGTERFMQRNRWHEGQQLANFRAWLAQKLQQDDVHQIVYEEVMGHGDGGSYAAHKYGEFLGIVKLAAHSRNIPTVKVSVGTIKKHWTGKGNAKKEAMVAEAQRRGFNPIDDNAADALAILSWAVAKEGTA